MYICYFLSLGNCKPKQQYIVTNDSKGKKHSFWRDSDVKRIPCTVGESINRLSIIKRRFPVNESVAKMPHKKEAVHLTSILWDVLRMVIASITGLPYTRTQMCFSNTQKQGIFNHHNQFLLRLLIMLIVIKR